jgi:hypothetical protein
VTDISAPTATDDLMARAELVALELIRRQIADLPAAIARNATADYNPDRSRSALPDRGRAADEGVSAVTGGGGGAAPPRMAGGRGGMRVPGAGIPGDLAGMLTARFAMVLGPMAIFAQALNSQASGFSVLGKVVQVIGGLLAAFLLPVVVSVAAALLDWADEMEGPILDSAKTFANFVMATLVPTIRFLVDNFELLSVGVLAVLAVMNPLATGIGLVIAAMASHKDSDAGPVKLFEAVAERGSEGLMDQLRKAGLIGGDEEEGGEAGGKSDGWGAAFGAAVGGGGAGKLSKGTEDVLASLRMSLAPKPMNMAIGSVYSQVQNQIAGTDPIEQRILATLMKILGVTEDAARGMLAKEAKPAFGAGFEDVGDF